MGKKYLLDSNICIHFLRGKFDVQSYILRIGWDNCCISEMTVAELLCGAEYSNDPKGNREMVDEFCSDIEIVPISGILREYARQKVALRRIGTLIDDVDLFIGATATALGYVMVTENVKHLTRIPGICIENWIKR